jgi:hypothetical protein
MQMMGKCVTVEDHGYQYSSELGFFVFTVLIIEALHDT